MSFDNSNSEWDQRQLFNERLHWLFSQADACSINDDYDNWFDSLRGVKRMINAFLNEEEKRRLDDDMKKARNYAKVGARRLVSFDRSLVQDSLDKLHTTLYDYAHQYKLLLPRSEAQGSSMYEEF